MINKLWIVFLLLIYSGIVPFSAAAKTVTVSASGDSGLTPSVPPLIKRTRIRLLMALNFS